MELDSSQKIDLVVAKPLFYQPDGESLLLENVQDDLLCLLVDCFLLTLEMKETRTITNRFDCLCLPVCHSEDFVKKSENVRVFFYLLIAGKIFNKHF